MTESLAFSASLLTPFESLVPAGITLRPLASTDHSRAHLTVLSALTTVPDPGPAAWCAQFALLQSTPDTYYPIVLLDSASDQILALGTVFLERKFIRGLGTAAHIEDIAVGDKAQGRGLGKVVIQVLTGLSESLGAYKVRRSRQSATSLTDPQCRRFWTVIPRTRVRLSRSCSREAALTRIAERPRLLRQVRVRRLLLSAPPLLKPLLHTGTRTGASRWQSTPTRTDRPDYRAVRARDSEHSTVRGADPRSSAQPFPRTSSDTPALFCHGHLRTLACRFFCSRDVKSGRSESSRRRSEAHEVIQCHSSPGSSAGTSPFPRSSVPRLPRSLTTCRPSHAHPRLPSIRSHDELRLQEANHGLRRASHHLTMEQSQVH